MSVPAQYSARVYSVGTAPRRLANALLPTGAIWLYGAGLLQVVSLFTPWIQVPLINAWSAWLLPIDLGWGFRSGVISYGVLVAMLALFFFWRGAQVTDWRAIAPIGRRSGYVMRPRRLLWMSLLAIAPSLLFFFQALFVDYSLMAALQDDETQYLLLTRHLGYTLLAQHFPLPLFQFTVNGVTDRLTMLVELAGTGFVMPVLSAVLCLIGAYFLRPDAFSPLVGSFGAARVDRPDEAQPLLASLRAPRPALARPSAPAAPPQSASTDEPPAESDDLVDWRRWRGWLIAAAVVVGLLIFGRAPAGLYAKSLGLAALNQGYYQTALNDFNVAATLNPTLTDLPEFDEERGQALYMLGDKNTLDAGLYLAAQYTIIYAPNQAWGVERELLRLYPTNQPLIYVTDRTLATLIERNTQVAITPTDNEQEALNPQVAISVATVDNALPWLDRLLLVQPGNVYALYMHGRVLYSARSYESAGSDFFALAHESHDANMQSAAYTYIALCYAGLNNFSAERSYLQLAVGLDHDYNNTTARTTASGLH